MDSVSGYAGEPRSGGKILRPRRRAVFRKPYDRPPSPPRSQDPPPQQNSSWISKFVYKPATVIASGAGKFISSVVFSESSSSSEEDDEDFASDEDEDAEKNITDFTEDETTDIVDAGGSTIQRLGSKRAIEQLLMQETFAREEGDRLIDIIKARIVDNPSDPTANGGSHGLANDVYADEMSRKAVMEAIKWSEEKKAGSSSKNEGIEDGPGSPVFVAKSYMQTRPRRGSPAVNNLEFQSPSSAGMQLFKDGTPFPYSAGSFSSSKLKRKSRSIQSWNIQDEIRKVRVKATEEMLKGVSPSTVASLEPKHSPYVLDASLNADKGFQAVQIERSRVPPKSTIPTTEKDQTMEGNQADEEAVALHTRSHGVVLDETFISTQGVKPSEDTNTPRRNNVVNEFGDQDGDFIQPSSTTEVTTNAVLALGATLDPTGNFCVPKVVFETSKEADETGAARHTSNGYPSSTPSLPVAMEGQPKSKPPDDETEASQPVAETPGDDITVENGSDGAIDNEKNNSDSSASHNSSSTHEEEWLPGDQSLPNSNSASSSPGNTKVLANSKRGGRGRGRGRGGRGGRGKGRAK